MTAAIEMCSASKVFEDDEGARVLAVNRMNLTVRAGQVVGLLGPAGSGKTTVLKMLACIESPTSGLIRLGGFDVVAERDAAAEQVTVEFGEPTTRKKPWPQRLEPFDRPVALIDEPALSPTRFAPYLEAVRSGARTRERRRTLVLATRDVALVRDVCDRAVFLEGGAVVVDLALHGGADADGAAWYSVVVKGRLDPHRTAYFDGLEVEALEGATAISGAVEDQAALHGLLTKVRDLGIPLVSVSREEPDLERILSRIRR